MITSIVILKGVDVTMEFYKLAKAKEDHTIKTIDHDLELKRKTLIKSYKASAIEAMCKIFKDNSNDSTLSGKFAIAVINLYNLKSATVDNDTTNKINKIYDFMMKNLKVFDKLRDLENVPTPGNK